MYQDRNIPGVDQGMAITYEQLKAGINDTDPDQVAQQLDRDIANFMLEHRVTAKTLQKQVSV